MLLVTNDFMHSIMFFWLLNYLFPSWELLCVVWTVWTKVMSDGNVVLILPVFQWKMLQMLLRILLIPHTIVCVLHFSQQHTAVERFADFCVLFLLPYGSPKYPGSQHPPKWIDVEVFYFEYISRELNVTLTLMNALCSTTLVSAAKMEPRA